MFLLAYKILYAKEASYRYPIQKQKSGKKAGRLWLVLLFAAAALWVRLYGIPDFLIPGDPEVTRTAASDFMSNMQTGMQVGEAITVFCEQIVDGAGI